MPKKIVVVDDEPDILKVIVFRLVKAGYDVVPAADGKEGLSRIREERPDLVVLDYLLPDMTGVEVAMAMRSDPASVGTPVILVSASSAQDISAAMATAGISAYVKKPFEPSELLAVVKRCLEREKSHE